MKPLTLLPLLLLVFISHVHSAKNSLQERSKAIKLCKNVFSPVTLELMDLKKAQKVVSKQNNLLSYILCMNGQLKLIRLEVYVTQLSKSLSTEAKKKLWIDFIQLIEAQQRQLLFRKKEVQKEKWSQAQKMKFLAQMENLLADARELIQEIKSLFNENAERVIRPPERYDSNTILQSFAQLRHQMDIDFINIVTEALNVFSQMVWTKIQPEQLSKIINSAVYKIEQYMHDLAKIKVKIDKGGFSILRLHYLKKQYKNVWYTAISLLDLLESQEVPDRQKCGVSFLEVEQNFDLKVAQREEKRKQKWEAYIMCMSIQVRNVRYQVYKIYLDKQASQAKKRIIYSKGQLKLIKIIDQLKAQQKQLMKQFFAKIVKQQLAKMMKLVRLEAKETIGQIKLFMKGSLPKARKSKPKSKRRAEDKQAISNLKKNLSSYIDWKSLIQISWFQAISVTVNCMEQIIYEIISIQTTIIQIAIKKLRNIQFILEKQRKMIKDAIKLSDSEKLFLTVEAGVVLSYIADYIKYFQQYSTVTSDTK